MQTAQGFAITGFPFLELLPGDVRPELLHGGKFSSLWEFPLRRQKVAATRENDNSCVRLRSPKRPARAVRGLSVDRSEAPLESPVGQRSAEGIC